MEKNVTQIVRKLVVLKTKNAINLVKKHVAQKKEKTKRLVKLIVKCHVVLKIKKKSDYFQLNVSSIFCTSFLMYPMAGAKES